MLFRTSMRNYLLITIIACLMMGCEESKQDSASVKFNTERVHIRFHGEYSIIIDAKTDSIYRFSFIEKDTMINNQLTSVTDSQCDWVKYSEALSDSIISHCYKIIRDTATINDEVTCYAGEYVTISIKKGSAKYSAGLESVSCWKNSSYKYRNLFNLLNSKGLLK